MVRTVVERGFKWGFGLLLGSVTDAEQKWKEKQHWAQFNRSSHHARIGVEGQHIWQVRCPQSSAQQTAGCGSLCHGHRRTHGYRRQILEISRARQRLHPCEYCCPGFFVQQSYFNTCGHPSSFTRRQGLQQKFKSRLKSSTGWMSHRRVRMFRFAICFCWRPIPWPTTVGCLLQ